MSTMKSWGPLAALLLLLVSSWAREPERPFEITPGYRATPFDRDSLSMAPGARFFGPGSSQWHGPES